MSTYCCTPETTFNDINAFLRIASKSQSYPEFMIQIVLHGNAKVGTPGFFQDVVSKIILSKDKDAKDFPFTINYPNIDYVRVRDYLARCFQEIPWLADYIAAKKDELKPKDNLVSRSTPI